MSKVEKNKKMLEHVALNAQEIKNFREAMKARYGIDPMTDTKNFPVMEAGFSWTALKQKLALKEADASSSFVQFLRAGIQTITNNAYVSHPTTYERWVTTVQSKKDQELYPINQGVSFPRQVGPSEKFPEVAAAALDLSLKNLKYGAMYAVERELLEDDQSGTFQMQAAKLGEYLKLLNEVLCYGKLASVSSMQYIDFKIPRSETQPSSEATYPWSTSLVGGGANRPASFSIITKDAVQAAKVGLMNQKNLQGIKMNVVGDLIICGPQVEFDASILLNSAFYPSNLAGVAGATGQISAINPIKGIADLCVSPYVFKNDGTVNGDSKAWYLVDSKKPWFIHQVREVGTIEQEAVNAGESFERDIYRFKARARMNADFLDSRFAWQGNDGSVTS